VNFINCPIEGATGVFYANAVTAGSPQYGLNFISCNLGGKFNFTGIQGSSYGIPKFTGCHMFAFSLYGGCAIISGCTVLTATSAIVFDMARQITITGSYIDAHSSSVLFKFASLLGSVTVVGNIFHQTLPATIFDSYDATYKRTTNIKIADNAYFNPFLFINQKTDANGRVSVSVPGNVAMEKFGLSVAVTGNYTWYVHSWITPYGGAAHYIGVVIQIISLDGIKAPADVTVDVRLLTA
jgi:hypothetical protein